MITAEMMFQYTAPGWMRQALCRTADPALFHPELGEDNTPKITAAKRVCRYCPVKKQCLDWAFETGDRYAVLGETTPNQRTRIARGTRGRQNGGGRRRVGRQGNGPVRVRRLSPG